MRCPLLKTCRSYWRWIAAACSDVLDMMVHMNPLSFPLNAVFASGVARVTRASTSNM
jgi:hypothetical protein